MNERIRALAEQARCFTETYDNELLSEPALLYCFHEDDFKKFAELIVRECALVVHKKTGPKSALDVLEHFGVKE